jgi:hypothetical protein
MGIYADLAKKRAAQYDKALEGRCQAWIEGVLGRKFEGDFREGLMDGQALCELVNKLVPGSIKKIHKSPVVLFRRENFGFFQNACLKLGCIDAETCVFEDVYEDRNMGLFLVNVIALARNTQYRDGYSGPILEDASKNSGQGAHVQHEAKYIPSIAEEHAKEMDKVAQIRGGEQGIVMTQQKSDARDVGSAYDLAAAKVGEAKAHAHYTEHGIIMDPNDPTAPQAPAAKGGYVPSAAEEAAAQADRAKGAKYVEHGILMNPDENPAKK